ncbi:MAG: NAD(P)H-binding protein [Bacteroidetes bacterium]|nr:NAD(P)H-binding protein [Bacteroidota bacterium]
MKILLAGANSYVGSRLLPFLLDKGHEIVYVARDKQYFAGHNKYNNITVLNGDLLRRQSIEAFPENIDAAFYLANRLTQTSGFAALEALSAQNFMDRLNLTQCKQVITIGAVGSAARTHVENILANGKAALTGLQTSMVIGEGSIALELFEALTQNTPIVITKTWAKTLLQPIYIGDVLTILHNCLLNKSTYNHMFEIGGPQQLSFKQMMLLYIAVNKEEKPGVVILPFLNSKLASYLVNFLSPISYPDAQALIQNLDKDSVCENINPAIMPAESLTFKQSLILIHDKSGEKVLA